MVSLLIGVQQTPNLPDSFNVTLTIKGGTFEKCPANDICVFPILPLSNGVKFIKS